MEENDVQLKRAAVDSMIENDAYLRWVTADYMEKYNV